MFHQDLGASLDFPGAAALPAAIETATGPANVTTTTELLESARDSNDPVVLALREELR